MYVEFTDHQDKFRFLNQGNSPDIVKVSDLDQFSETIGALNTLGFTQGEVKFQTLTKLQGADLIIF